MRVLLVGMGGYGRFYVKMLLPLENIEFAGVVDPFAEKSAVYEEVVISGIPIYNTISEFFDKNSADLAVIVTPVTLHKEHCIKAFENSCNVLCEKPLAPTVKDAKAIEEAAIKHKKVLAVGFQWSFSDVILDIKRDIKTGKLGKPVALKTMVSWPRAHKYYKKGWTGKIKNQKGEWVLDSIASNATSHYLHNMLYVLGEDNLSEELSSYEAELYRANEIPSFDTCFLKGKTKCGVPIFYYVSHATDVNENPKFLYEFEKGYISFNVKNKDSMATAYFNDGSVKVYGNPLSQSEQYKKFIKTAEAVKSGGEVPCGAKTVYPHMKVSNSLFECCSITDFPKDVVAFDAEQELTYVKGMYEILLRCFNDKKLPSELGYSFAKVPDKVNLEQYKSLL